jgi:predicted ferric reductase
MIAVFGGFLVMARWTGFATLLFTAVLFLTMSRSLLTMLYRITPAHWRLCRVLDSHTALHIFSGQMMFFCAVLHVFAHLLSTYSAIEREPVEELNQVLKCASEDDRSPFKEAFSANFPPCPLERNLSLSEAIFTTTAGLSGLGLLAVISVMGFTARHSKRHTNFELFYYVHLAGTGVWFMLLFVHGMQDWFGAWVPLVILVCTLPACCVVYDKIHRWFAFYGRTRDVRILSAIIRPGMDRGTRGALTALKIKKPDFLWHMKDGMYALLCMPEYSSFQWHPFTIISSKDSDTVDFIVSGLGDWTCELARKVLDHHQGITDELPLVALDGPFSAPVATALQCKVIIAIGSGIGITPFLALMTQLLAALNSEPCDLPLREAHVFWIARSADEFLFGRRHFTRIVASASARNRIFLHLHCTQKEPSHDSPAFIFREAVKRQSQLDRKAFLAARCGIPAAGLVASPTLPWAWAHGSSCDTIWVNFISEKLAEQQETELAESCQAHWGSKKSRSSSASQASSSSLDISCSSLDTMLPICFGRPEWHTEIQAIGKAWPEDDVHVYVCGSDAVVDSLQNACRVCNIHSPKACRKQRFILRRESFGS